MDREYKIPNVHTGLNSVPFATNDKDKETNDSVVTKDMGYLSSVTDARIFLEKLYKKKNNS